VSATATATVAAAYRGRRSRLGGLFHAEVVKLAHQWSTWLAIAAAAALFLAVVGWGGAGQAPVRALFRHDAEGWMRSVLPGVQMLFQYGSGVLLLVVAARSVGADYASGAMRVLLARGVGRVQLLAAKLLALCCLAAVLLTVGAILVALYFGSVAVAAEGSLRAFAHVSPALWQTLGLSAVSEVASMAAAIAVGTTAAVVGRSVAFGVGVALAVYPADSLYTQWSPLLVSLTHQRVWTDVTRVLLGPNLNALSQHLRAGPPSGVPLPTPVGGAGALHATVVVAVWVAAMLVTSAAMLHRRDVLQ
jgi:ABC-type transport system involved in multi-copper enzyme maturation permease subunit